MAAVVTIIMFDERMYTGTGLVHRWITGVGAQIEAAAVANAPVRTGELKGSIQGDSSQVGIRAVETVVEATAEHAKWVIGGTGTPKGTGFIYSRGGWLRKAEVNRMLGSRSFFPSELRGPKGSQRGLWMKVQDGGPKWHLRVRGQRPNNFLVDAYNQVSRTHRALRPMGPRGGLI